MSVDVSWLSARLAKHDGVHIIMNTLAFIAWLWGFRAELNDDETGDY